MRSPPFMAGVASFIDKRNERDFRFTHLSSPPIVQYNHRQTTNTDRKTRSGAHRTLPSPRSFVADAGLAP